MGDRKKDADANVAVGDVLLQDTRGSYIHAGSRLVAALGVDRHIIVETADAVFVCPRDRSQEVKQVVQRLKAAHRPEVVAYRRVSHPWDFAVSLTTAEDYRVAHIAVRPGAGFSNQERPPGAVHWVVVGGTAEVRRGDETFTLEEAASAHLPADVPYHLRNPAKTPLTLVEIRPLQRQADHL